MDAGSGELSANAAEFVPNQDPGSLPKYIFNCYPFVTEPSKGGNKSREKAGGKQIESVNNLQNQGRHQHRKGVVNGAHFPAPIAHFYSPQGPLYNQISPQNVFQSHSSFYPVPRCPNSLSGHNRLPGPRLPYNNNYMQSHQTPHFNPMHRVGPRPLHPHQMNGAFPPPVAHTNERHSWPRKQKPTSKERPKVSVGTQNEKSKHVNNKPASGSRSATRTIILVDTAAQTDFAEDIADHTLEQVPNALYQGKRKLRRKVASRQQGASDSTDSEEVDHSDSGYSSPLHKQNQISSGTDARSKTLEGGERGPTTLLHANNSHQTATGFGEGQNMSYARALTSNRVSPVATPLPQSLPLSIAQQDGATSEHEETGGKKKKRKRGRRRKRKEKSVEEMNAEDSTERPFLSTTPRDYHSPILSQETTFNLLAPDSISENFPSFAEAGLYDDSAECKLSGKRKKRREQANKAAMEEQLEIDLEQQALKVVNQTPVIVKPVNNSASAPTGGKKSQQPVSINLLDMISAPKKAQSENEHISASSKKNSGAFSSKAVLNPLDSTAPVIKRGKEREVPRAKKPSALKKVILKEREERKRLRYIGDGPVDIISTPDSSLHFTSEPEENDDDVISDMEDHNSLANSLGDDSGTPHSQDLSPLSQNSPISVGLLSPPTSLSNPASGVGSPTVVNDIIQKIHSRRFREYCKQVLDKEIDINCTNLLQTLVKFQDRLYHKDPMKAKIKRRLVLGLREVTKHLKLRRVKLVIISPNLEKIRSKGGLDDALNMIINLCREQDVPFVFALGRRSLGRACAKLVPVSVVGVFNYQGAEAMYNELIELTSQAREAYHEMVDALAKEVAQYGGALKGSCGLYFSHLGHSRTPSGCSAISFTSSILSEPVSDVPNKPDHVINLKANGSNSEHVSSQISVPTSASGSVSESRGPLQDDIYDIDEGNEADTEDNDAANHGSLANDIAATTDGPNSTSKGHVCAQGFTNIGESTVCIKGSEDSSQGTMPELTDTVSHMLSQLTLKKRPSHDTHRHSRSNSGSHIEVRSQTSSRTLDQHDTVSTHSSVTIENASESEHLADPLGSSSSSCKVERIRSWVRDVDTVNTQATEISQDNAEFNATYTACEANTDVLISRSRSPSVSKS
ncbi:selenocysteine insertion sequence-binding protein 2-like [Watersipora subatra]|uniref:selenocysteine insertion sequence-binding protein 2-like n=1 Tax=Watersipora subatra TaxID=2589382 RepID=UPI00355B0826